MWRAVLKKVFQERRFRVTAWIAFVVYALLYLYASQFLVFGDAGVSGQGAVNILPGWQELMFRQRAPFLFEAVGFIGLTRHVTIFISIPNLILATILGIMVALNISFSYFVFRNLGLRGPKGMATLVGTIPALLGGAACCAPTLIILLGLQFTATLTAVWPWLVPVSFLMLAVGLWWSVRQASGKIAR